MCRDISANERGRHGCDKLRGYSVKEESGWISSDGEFANIRSELLINITSSKQFFARQVGGQDDHVRCQVICANTPHCVAYTFVQAAGRCDLKDSAGSSELYDGLGLVSGKLEELQQ